MARVVAPDRADTPAQIWHRSSRCDGRQPCAEVTQTLPGEIWLSKRTDAERIVVIFNTAEWRDFLTAIKIGKFDLQYDYVRQPSQDQILTIKEMLANSPGSETNVRLLQEVLAWLFPGFAPAKKDLDLHREELATRRAWLHMKLCVSLMCLTAALTALLVTSGLSPTAAAAIILSSLAGGITGVQLRNVIPVWRKAPEPDRPDQGELSP
jgi:hypothetical protein